MFTRIKALFDIMEWDEDLKYRFRGQLVEQGGDKLMLFELDQPEMIKVEEIVLPCARNLPRKSETEERGKRTTIRGNKACEYQKGILPG